MSHISAFDFLSDDKKFDQIYQECLAFEDTISGKLYTTSLRTGRTICELLIKKLAKTNSNLRKLFKYPSEDILLPEYGLSKLIKGCYHEKLIDKLIKEKCFDVKRYGDANAHGENYYEYGFIHCEKVHKLLFEISLFCFKKFHDDDLKYDYLKDLKYNFNLNSLEPTKVTVDERINLIDKIYENEINKNNFSKYMALNKIYLDINTFKEVLNDYKKYITNHEDLDNYLKTNDFLKEKDMSEILSFFDFSVKHQLYDDLKNANNNNIAYLYPYLDDFPQDFTIEYLSNLVSESNELEKNDFKLIRELAYNFLIDDLEVLTKELENEPVIEKDEYGRDIEKLMKYEIIRDDYGLKINQVEKSIFLDKDQESAVTYMGDKPLVINAGPGSGKTRVIIERVRFLVKNGVDPSTILVITFTNEATNELRNRLKNETDLDIEIINQIRISTVHAFCRYVIANYEIIPYNYLERYGERSLFLNKHREELGFTGFSQTHDSDVSLITRLYDGYFNFGLVAEDFADELRRRNGRKIKWEYKDFVKNFQEEYGTFPTFNQINDAGWRNSHYHAKWIAIVESYPKYNDLLEKYKTCDDNTILQKTYEILCRVEIPYKNILIDEFQDTNHHLMQIYKKLNENSDSFTIVGDSDQSIYGWRGARPCYFDRITDIENRENIEYVELHTNYRSTSDIVDFNEEFIKGKRNVPKKLKAKKQYKTPIYYLSNGFSNEYENIVKIIKSLHDDKKIKKYSDIGVLFRTNEQAMDFSNVLRENNIPFYLKGNKDLLEQNEIKSILLLLWYLMPYDKTSFIYRSDVFLNFEGFASDYNDEFFGLSDETKHVLKNIQSNFEKNVVEYAFNIDKSLYSYKKVFNKDITFIKEVVSNTNSYDLSDLDDFDLIKLGISNQNDINFFLKLKDIKSKMFGQNMYKPTSLEVYKQLLKLNGYIDKISIQNTSESIKILKNLSMVSRLIKDYEKIMGSNDYVGLFNYLNGVLQSYSSYIDETETFEDEVHVMTVHKSKGLEYPIVFVASLSDGDFPREYKTGLWHTNIEFLRYKPKDISEEKTQHNLEEMKMIYVAASRAKEILILSSNYFKPQCLIDMKKNENVTIKNLNLNNVNTIPAVESSNSSSSITGIPELYFEDIINNYLVCPYNYYISNDLNFAVEVSDDNHVEMVLHRLLNSIHSQKNLTEDDIKLKINTILNYHSISQFEEDKTIISNVLNYWNQFGKKYDILKNEYPVLKHLNNCDVFGTIDLIVKDENGGCSIVKFIGSDEKIFDMDYYEMILHFYYSSLKDDLEFKDKQLNSIILHSLNHNSIKTFDIKDTYEKFGLKELEKITSKILDQKFDKKSNCDYCEHNKFCNNN
ncbi:MAG: ATP-dependent helicase [Methanobrevibacter sp.]|uniref:ATP-dependent helicase n=1 Tax=Methanobrevibacter sp. TaxID=66852 RepID=UPI0025F02FD7|nr:ATP-dependent helicase [Methanobrevibacter sp.]MBE6507902.1 ATP-dependent helicase [Methanobrevibacter sp.]